MNCNKLFKHCIYASIFFLFLLAAGQVKAQISEGGKPLSFNYQNRLKSEQPAVEIPVGFSVEDLIAVDEWRVSRGAPLAVSTLIDTNLSIDNAGEWLTLPGGETIWRLRLQAKGALAMMLYYDTFYIPEGGKLFIYNAEKTHLLGAYTSQTNPTGKAFATEFVAGDDITLEYEPPLSGEKARLAIGQVGYGYNHLYVSERAKTGPGTSASCMVNINCEEGDEWQDEKNGVCQLVEKIGKTGYLCSGSLVNNTAKDMKPYILSAYHCTEDYDNGLIASAEELNQWVFYFHFEHTGCENTSDVVAHKTMTGCKRVVSIPIDGGSDGLLLLLNDRIPTDYNVYFNGWDRSDVPATSGVGIHHPSGDYMKISTFGNYPVETVTWLDVNNITGREKAHWNVVFDRTSNGYGVTEGGSSGSPLFNENRQIVGTLTGGNSTCRLTTGSNIYGKLSYHWNKYSQADTARMDIWLDPENTGVMTLPGLSQSGEEGSLVYHKPPTDVTAEIASSNSILIGWNAPIYKQLIGWGTQSSYAQLGCQGTPFYFGQRWEAKELENIHKKTITNVKFIPASNVNYAIYIRQGDRTYQQELSRLTSNRSNTIELKTPYIIDATSDLIISIYARKYDTTVYPAFIDEGPAIGGKGNLISFDGEKWEYLADEENDNNFILSATVTSEEGELTLSRAESSKGIQDTIGASSFIPTVQKAEMMVLAEEVGKTVTAFPVITGYTIYNNGEKRASVSSAALQYTDKNVEAGLHTYSVAASYNSKESKAATAKVAVRVNTEETPQVEEIGITPTLFTGRIQIKNHQHIRSIDVYAADGRIIRRINTPSEWLDMSGIPQGIYFFKLTTNSGKVSTLKGIKL